LRSVLAVVACLLAAAPAACASVPRSFVGLYGDDAFFGDSSYRQAEFAAQTRLGVGIIRQPFEWSRVERSPGHYDWSVYDAFMTDAASAGMSVMPVLTAPPDFRSSRPAGSSSHAMYPPASNAAYAAWVASAVERYGPTGSFWSENPSVPFLPIHAWQVWNEPNIPNFWRSGVDARAYVALLRAASVAIRRVDPHAEVVAAGLPNSHLGVPFLDYLNRMYAAGARGLFDTLAIHPYSRDVSGLLDLAERARVAMNRWGDAASRLWITEFGWSTGGDASAFRVSKRGQAKRIAAALSALYAERHVLRLRGFVLFKWRDSTPPPSIDADPWPLHTGLLDAGGNAKPGFYAFAREVGAIRLAPADWPVGSTHPVGLSRRSVTLSPLGYADVALGCASPGPGACAGRLVLQSARAVSCGGSGSLARGVVIGGTSFRMPMAPAIAPVRLTRNARRVALCAGRLRVRASLAGAGVARASSARAVEFELRAVR
jgi:hypothetical protein